MSSGTSHHRIKYLCIIQARITSTRFPNKVMQTVGGVPMVKRVWLAAKASFADKVIVAWPERYPNLDENDVMGRFLNLIQEFNPDYVIRLTADCPLITTHDINNAICHFEQFPEPYYSNHYDGHDVQIFNPWHVQWDREHVIADFSTKSTGLSVNTREDLERVRAIAKGQYWVHPTMIAG